MVVKDKEKYIEKIKAAVEYIEPNKTSASLFFFFSVQLHHWALYAVEVSTTVLWITKVQS